MSMSRGKQAKLSEMKIIPGHVYISTINGKRGKMKEYLIIVYMCIIWVKKEKLKEYLIIVYMGASPGISWHQLPRSDKLP